MAELSRPFILVVDDDAAVCHALTTMLGEGGYATQTASNGQDALDIVQRDQPALIITDVVMPGLDGWEVVVQLRQRGLSIPVILMSGYINSATTAHVTFLPKPVDPERLLTMVGEMLPKRRADD